MKEHPKETAEEMLIRIDAALGYVELGKVSLSKRTDNIIAEIKRHLQMQMEMGYLISREKEMT